MIVRIIATPLSTANSTHIRTLQRSFSTLNTWRALLPTYKMFSLTLSGFARSSCADVAGPFHNAHSYIGVAQYPYKISNAG